MFLNDKTMGIYSVFADKTRYVPINDNTNINFSIFCFFILFAVVDFFNRINLIYGTVSEYCNVTTCPTMSGGSRYEYLWADGEHFKKPTPLPAPKYIEFLMDWTEGQINNECVFPVSTDVPFPKSFTQLCRKILTRLFRVFVHVYIHHFDRIVSIGAVSILISLIVRFTFLTCYNNSLF